MRHSTHKLVLLLSLSACVIDTVPLPEERSDTGGAGFEGDNEWPLPDEAGINAGLLFTAGVESPIYLVGTEGCMDPGTKVRVTNPARANFRGEVEVAGDGSFNLPVNAVLGDEIGVFEVLNGIVLEGVTITVESPSADAYTAQAAFDTYIDTNGVDPATADLSAIGAIAVYPPDSTGHSTVVGQARAGMLVLVANTSLGNSTVATAAVNGSFSARLLAASGHMLGVTAVEPAASQAGPELIRVMVP